MAGVDNRPLLKEVRDLPDPRRNLLSHNERELIGLCRRLADALEESDKAYLTLFETGRVVTPRAFTED